MFLKQALKKNRPLLDFAYDAHGAGKILPDTYLLDLDAIRENAQMMLDAAKPLGLHLYFMLKQIGRNPAVAQMLTEMGFAGAVCVDFRDVELMMEHGIPIGHVGHLVQTPRGLLERLLAYGVEMMTVYSLEKAAEISAAARKLGRRQPIMLRVVGMKDEFFPGQVGGFRLEELARVTARIKDFQGVTLAGVTSFPCLSYEPAAGRFVAAPNCETVLQAGEMLRELGCDNLQINLPSATCCASIPMLAAVGGTHGEPGHALAGTTPYHAGEKAEFERPAIVYCSEVSHVYDGATYCYGGGRYCRGHLTHALVGDSDTLVNAWTPPADNIDYHFRLEGIHPVSAPVLMCFRTQIFVTRSEVALVEGLSDGNPVITGIYSAQGRKHR